MFCSKCGTKNEKTAKFCGKCGEPLDEKKVGEVNNTSNNFIDSGGIRKAMKADAKSKIKGSLIGATALYLVAALLIITIFGGFTVYVNGNQVVATNNALSFVSQLLTGFLAIVFGLGIMMVGFDAVRGKEYKWTDIFTRPFNHLDRLGYMLLMYVIIVAICFVGIFICLIPIIGIIAFMALIIYYLPVVELFGLIVADTEKNQKIDFVMTVKKALELAKGNRVEFYGVTFSFIGWWLLSILTFGILYIWLLPYMILTYNNLYQKWTKEKEFTATETGLSNGTVIGITSGGCGCGCLVMFGLLMLMLAFVGMAIKDQRNNPELKKWIDNNLTPSEQEQFNSMFG